MQRRLGDVETQAGRKWLVLGDTNEWGDSARSAVVNTPAACRWPDPQGNLGMTLAQTDTAEGHESTWHVINP